MSLRVLSHVAVKSLPGCKAKEYIISKIEQQIGELLEKGPDNKSTLSGMVFVVDEESGQKLSCEEIIDNALVLIFARSETSANTLTNAMIFFGLHPSVWDKLVKEQETLIVVEGDVMKISNLDTKKCTLPGGSH